MSDDETLRRAAAILTGRKAARKAKTERLHLEYAHKRAGEPHHLGKPRKLAPDEALLLVALEHNQYDVEADYPNGNRWHGDASCTKHIRATVIITLASSRLDLLWAMWAAVSDQDDHTVILTEAHLSEVQPAPTEVPSS